MTTIEIYNVSSSVPGITTILIRNRLHILRNLAKQDDHSQISSMIIAQLLPRLEPKKNIHYGLGVSVIQMIFGLSEAKAGNVHLSKMTTCVLSIYCSLLLNWFCYDGHPSPRYQLACSFCLRWCLFLEERFCSASHELLSIEYCCAHFCTSLFLFCLGMNGIHVVLDLRMMDHTYICKLSDLRFFFHFLPF